MIVIPTFISSRSRKARDKSIAAYDHVTNINEEGELGRCLASLEKVDGIGLIVVLVSADDALTQAATEKVRRTVSQFPDLSVLVIGDTELQLIRSRMEQLGLPNLDFEMGLDGYGAIRNLGLAIASIFGFDSVVFLDDDEVIDDPRFLAKAMYGLGKLTKKGVPILAKTGYYLNDRNSYLSKSEDAWYNRYWRQGSAFNTWITAAMKGPRLSRSNHVCGGCLAIHKEAFKRLAFDPWISRGEDLDYLLNLRMYGSDIWFDNKWYLYHLPPESTSEGDRFHQDIYRWLYEYRKLEYSRALIDIHQVKPQSLEPYPGPFLQPGLAKRIRKTAYLRSLVSDDKQAYRRAAKAVRNEASAYAEANCTKFFQFQYDWPNIIGALEQDEILSRSLVQSALGLAIQKNEIDPGVTSEIRLDLSE